MVYTTIGKFISCQAGALISWTRFIDPDMNRNTFFLSGKNRSQRRTIVNTGKPSGITMSKNIYRFSFFIIADFFRSEINPLIPIFLQFSTSFSTNLFCSRKSTFPKTRLPSVLSDSLSRTLLTAQPRLTAVGLQI